ncbi:MAG: hypothetical protein JNM14_11310 [Ferruginibacter sp.]|nr:hypothetical protein [Ferruginibacter sp.]
MKIILLLTFLFAAVYHSNAQTLDQKVSLAIQRVYDDYKQFFDSSLLDKYVVLDKMKSYLVNAGTQKIKTIALTDDSFVFDEFSLRFAIVYKGDTIRHLPVCRLDTRQTLMALGTPSNPVRHGDLLPPYMELVKGNIRFDYKKLKKLLSKMQLQTTETDLQVLNRNADGTHEYMWVVTTSCPELKCRVLRIDANNGKIIADIKPE